MSSNPKVLFQTEASYPYEGGGVATWAHILCSELADDIDFHIFAITGQPNVDLKYDLPRSIKEITHVPLWGAEQPVDYYEPERPFSDIVSAKLRTTDRVVQTYFEPLFRDFLDALFRPESSEHNFGELIYGFWLYCRYYDYKVTMQNRRLWEIFREQIYNRYPTDKLDLYMKEMSLRDVTFAMRWLYHFLMPVDVGLSDVDITHATLSGFPGIPSIVQRYHKGTPFIITDHGVWMREQYINVHNAEFEYYSKKFLLDLSYCMVRAVYENSDHILPVTRIHEPWEKRMGATPEKIEAIYNGIDSETFSPQPKPPKTQDIPTVVAVAQVFPLKDIETMIRSCDYARREIPDIQYRVYGSLDVNPEYAKRCQNLVKELELEDHFIFGGFHENPSEVYNEGDLTILSSISEGVPYTILESMSCARPVVATDVGGVREAIEGCGVICKPADPEDLAKGVVELLKDDQKRIELGRKSRERVLLHYTREKTVTNYKETYHKWQEKDLQPACYEIDNDSVNRIQQHIDPVNDAR